MSAKAPIYLKRASRKGKKEKLRDILSSDMISSPLGDFRHTIHIGSGGEDDIFGDISFLKGKFHLLPGKHGGTLSQKAGRYVSYEFTRTASLHGDQQQLPENPSPLLKNAISLPVIGGSQAVTPPIAEAPPKPPRLHLDDKDREPPAKEPASKGKQEDGEGGMKVDLPDSVPTAGPLEAKEVSQKNQGTNNLIHSKVAIVRKERPEKTLLSHAVSLLSLHLDLGPSILDDVLQIMDKEQDVRPSVGALVHESSPRCEILSLQ
ncbi:cdc42 effector protein 2-like [Heterodontus francisci]|uniref:cdc42 effector protein 2-like n=1 Tax=Heterodontus francisci TaxID=7792 RepID=UPI00355BE8CE